MNRRQLLTTALSAAPILLRPHSLSAAAVQAEHVNVYAVPGRFGGWPANHGMWAWGDELLVGFEAGHFRSYQGEGREHSIDYGKPAEHLLARSLDGGQSWKLEKPASLLPPEGTKQAGVPTEPGGKPATACPGGLPLTAPGFALTARMADIHVGPSRLYWSKDKGKNWAGPFTIDNFGFAGIAARTDYLVDDKKTVTLFLTAAKANRKEGRVICVRSSDAGKSFQLVGSVCPDPEGNDFAIMPSSLRLKDGSLLCTLRRRQYIASYRSTDNGRTWTEGAKPVSSTGGGNPPALVALRDGRLALTFGYRMEPYSIRAVLSEDQGKTWGPEITLRADGGAWDLGYTRTVQRKDGKLVTVYYYNTNKNGERFIGATIWDPAKV